MQKQNTFLAKLKRAKKAVVSTLGSCATAVAVFAPQWDDEYKVATGVVGALFTGLITYFTTNEDV